MECRDVRNLAEAYVSDQLMVETAETVAAHLELCASCRREIDGVRRLRAAVRSSFDAAQALAPRPEFVASLGARLRAEAQTPARRATRSRTWMAIAASLLLVAGGLELRSMGVAGFAAVVQAAVHDHRFCYLTFGTSDAPIALDEAATRYGDPADRFLLDVEPAATTLSGGPIRIVERHSCVYEGRRFAHLVLKYKNVPISLIVTPDDRMLAGLPSASAPANGSVISVPAVEGLQVAAFRGPHHAAFVIASLPDDDLREVAAAVAPGVSKALRGQ